MLREWLLRAWQRSEVHRMMAQQASMLRTLAPSLSAFGSVDGFEQRDLMATSDRLAWAPEVGFDTLRAIQCDMARTYALVRLPDASRSRSSHAIGLVLHEAGYRRRRHTEELVMERGLAGAGEVARELDILKRLDALDTALSLPHRTPARELSRRRRRSAREWHATLEAVAQSKMTWDTYAISFERKGRLHEERQTVVEVRASVLVDVGQPPDVCVLVRLSVGEREGSKAALRAMRSLAAAGYERSEYSADYCGAQTFRSASLAARESQRVFAALTSGG